MYKLEVVKDYPFRKVRCSRIILSREYTTDEFVNMIAEKSAPYYGSIILMYAGMVQDCSNFSNGILNIPIVGELHNAIVKQAFLKENAEFSDGRYDFILEIDAGYVHAEIDTFNK